MFGHPTFSTIPASCTTKSQSLHHCSAPASLLFELPQVHAYLPCWTAGAGEAYIKRLLSSPWDAGITCCNNFIPFGVSLTNPNLRYLWIDNTNSITLDICAPRVTHLELHGNLRTDYVLKELKPPLIQWNCPFKRCGSDPLGSEEPHFHSSSFH